MQAIFPITTQGLSDSFYTLEIKYNELPRNIPSRCWDYLISLFRVNFCKHCLVKQKKLAGVPAILGHPKMNYWREKYQGTWIYKIFVRKQEEIRNVRSNWWLIEKTLHSVFVRWKLFKIVFLFLFVQDLKYWSIKNKKINVKILLSTFRTSTTQRHKIKTKVRTNFDFETSYDRNNKRSRSFYNSSTEKMDNGTRRMSGLENSNCDKNENGKCENVLVESSNDEIITANESDATILTGEVQNCVQWITARSILNLIFNLIFMKLKVMKLKVLHANWNF